MLKLPPPFECSCVKWGRLGDRKRRKAVVICVVKLEFADGSLTKLRSSSEVKTVGGRMRLKLACWPYGPRRKAMYRTVPYRTSCTAFVARDNGEQSDLIILQ